MCPHRAASLFTLTSSRRFPPVAYDAEALEIAEEERAASSVLVAIVLAGT
jgi:hypothetical protein